MKPFSLSKKAFRKESNNIRPTLRSRPGGVMGRILRRGMMGACGKPPTPLLMNEDSTVIRIKIIRSKPIKTKV